MFTIFVVFACQEKSVKMQLAGLLKIKQSVVFYALLTFAKANIFILEPKDVNVVDLEGAVVDDVTLTCKANLTNAIYHWKKDGEVISAGDRYKISKNGTLTINPLRVSDAGNYRCLATTDKGTALSNSAKLEITFINDFGHRSKTSYSTEAGEGIAIPCEKANFAPENSVYSFWESLDHFIIYGKHESADYYVSQDGTLYFANPTTDLTDNYFCFIRDKWNLPNGRRIEKSSQNIALEVSNSNKLIPPTILLNPKNVTYAKVGSTVMLECFAGGNPTPTLKWTKINGSLPSNHVITDAGQLELPDITHDVTGTYQCTASNKKGNVTTQGEIIVSETLFLNRRIFSQNVDFHETATFRCEASGIPPPTYRWLKNGEPINMTSRVNVDVGTKGGSVMTIAEVGDDDVAIWQCVAENPLGSLISNAVLRIKELSPRFATGFDQIESLKNKTSILKCTVGGYPRPRIYWMKDGVNITNNVKILNKGSLTEGVLLIQNASKSDEGTYSCTATNNKGTITESKQLVVYEPTVAVAVKDTVVVLRGKNQILQCNETHDERLETTWSWNHLVGENETDVITYINGTLQLKEVGDGQEGSYKCCISSKFDRNCATIRLSIAEPTVAVAVEDTVEVLRGQNQTLQCNETHDKRLETKWSWTHFVDGIETDVVDNAEGTLQLKQVGDGQAGSYKCCVSTNIDQNCATTHLSIADLPTTPIHVDVINSSTTSQHLTWDDQSSDVIQYKVEGRLEQEDNWFTFDCDVNKPCFASNLLPYNEYVYRVYSINKYGISNASEISKPQRTTGGAPSLAPSGVNATLKDGNILVTWNTYPAKYFGSAKVFYIVKYRACYNEKSDDGKVISKWIENNETNSSATSTLINISKSKKTTLYIVKVAVGNEFGQSSFSELFEITIIAIQDENRTIQYILLAASISALIVSLVLLVLRCVRKHKLKRSKKRGLSPKDGSEFELDIILSTKVPSSNKTSQQDTNVTEEKNLEDEKDKLLDEKDTQANLQPTGATSFPDGTNSLTKDQHDLSK